MIETSKDKRGSHQFTINGNKLPRCFTPETPEIEVKKFAELLQENEVEIEKLLKEFDEKITWNQANFGKGRDWPIFRKIERFLDSLQVKAGIKDS